MNKKISFSTTGREKILEGINKLSQAVTSTLGPAGRNVIIEQSSGLPVSTKDGVTVAKSIRLEDNENNIGVELVKQASIKTADEAGDGTTTSTVVANSLITEGIKSMNDQMNVVKLKQGIDLGVEKVIEYLEETSTDIENEEQLKQIASISGNNDSEVGEIIAAALDKVGTDGVVSIEESKTGETYLETVEGMQFDRGYKSPYFVTDNKSMSSVLKDPFVLITDKKLNQVKELLPILEGISQQNKPVLIIADDLDGEALSTLVVNKMRGILSVAAVKAPDFGDRKKAVLEDIATLTGGKVISHEKGMRLDKFDPSWLGSAGKVTVTKDSTTIIDASGNEETIEARINEIKQQIDDAQSPFEKENLQNRLAKFVGGVAVVHVGGRTEVEIKERKDRVEDALHATKAAVQEGILPGGGVSLLNASAMLSYYISDNAKELNSDILAGIGLVASACTEPSAKIISNAGYEEEEVDERLEVITSNDSDWYGFNPIEDTYTDMFKSGIIDPTKVTRLALQNAASVAGTVLLTEAVISNIPEENSNPVPGMNPNMMM